jgi:hypothetical protein
MESSGIVESWGTHHFDIEITMFFIAIV